MSLPYLERLDPPFFVITREASTVPTITALTGTWWCRGPTALWAAWARWIALRLGEIQQDKISANVTEVEYIN